MVRGARWESDSNTDEVWQGEKHGGHGEGFMRFAGSAMLALPCPPCLSRCLTSSVLKNKRRDTLERIPRGFSLPE
jgi:hypothetical protein